MTAREVISQSRKQRSVQRQIRKRFNKGSGQKHPLIFCLIFLLGLCFLLPVPGLNTPDFLYQIFTNHPKIGVLKDQRVKQETEDEITQNLGKQAAFILSSYGISSDLQRGIELTGKRIGWLTGSIQEETRIAAMLEQSIAHTEKAIDSEKSIQDLKELKNHLEGMKEEVRIRNNKTESLKNQLELHQRFLEQIKMEYNLPAILKSEGNFNPQALISQSWNAQDWPTYSEPVSSSETMAEETETEETKRTEEQTAAGWLDVNENQPDPALDSYIFQTESQPLGGPVDMEVESWDKACAPMGFSIPDSWSEHFIRPVSGWLSAGTWNYPGGGLHLGADFASPLKTPVLAPAHGVILYADVCADENGGYLGNYIGWPYGGGNTLAMICMVEGELFAITFAHLSQSIYVQAGMEVEQGTVIALSGNSGNSTGPHTHIEVFKLHVSLEEAINYFLQGADFSFGTGWNEPAACSAIACQIRPEEIFG